MSTATPVPVAILVRVSTNKQDTTRQVSELRALAEVKGWNVVEVCREEGVSGRAAEDERHGLKRAEALASSGKVKRILVHEVSRLGRRSSIVHAFVERLEESRVSLYWHAQGIETLLANGKRNPAASIMLALLAEMARSETETLRERINSGLAEARRKGVKLGRPAGSGYDAARLLSEHRDIVKALKAGQSVRNAAKITGKGASTVQRVKAAMIQQAIAQK
ncbi:MAG: recombinase family protein [Verrucomicrobiaceae bacterium]|nr:recombinase family protein [Verrucomicrobiaceae bacterium]